jgi:hypothetical protein
MKEIYGDMWDYMRDGNILVITTNGTIKRNGCAVMGRGNALQASRRFQGIEETLGFKLKLHGNRCFILIDRPEFKIVSFPVKRNWYEKADLELIRKSAHDLDMIVSMFNWQNVIVPRPGVGNGGLQWENVKDVLEPVFDDRFSIITNEEGNE